MFDLPCEYGKCPGKCTHEEALDDHRRAKIVFAPHCRFGICYWWEPNRDRLQTYNAFQQLREERET